MENFRTGSIYIYRIRERKIENERVEHFRARIRRLTSEYNPTFVKVTSKFLIIIFIEFIATEFIVRQVYNLYEIP